MYFLFVSLLGYAKKPCIADQTLQTVADLKPNIGEQTLESKTLTANLGNQKRLSWKCDFLFPPAATNNAVRVSGSQCRLKLIWHGAEIDGMWLLLMSMLVETGSNWSSTGMQQGEGGTRYTDASLIWSWQCRDMSRYISWQCRCDIKQVVNCQTETCTPIQST